MLGCALLKVQLRELLTCLELETARSLVKWHPEVEARCVHLCPPSTVRQTGSIAEGSQGSDFISPVSPFEFPASLRKKTVRMPMVTRRLRDPDTNPCLLMAFYLLTGAYFTYLRNLMLLPDVWMKITMTRKGVPLTS
ncbi:coiled-coil-helix-coiled-coil-helix domain-containing protein 7 isoform 2-T2 [Glossophaga mutica]